MPTTKNKDLIISKTFKYLCSPHGSYSTTKGLEPHRYQPFRFFHSFYSSGFFIGVFFFVTQISQMTKEVSNPMKKDLSRQGELDAQTEVLCRRRITAA